MAGPFVTAAEYSEWTGMPLRDDLSRIQSVLATASALIRGEVGQTLSVVTGDVIVVQPEYDATTGRRSVAPRAIADVIYLPEGPVTAVAITVAAVAFTAFTFNAEGVVQRTDGLAWTAPATITYTHGYAETSEEFQRIREVCMAATARAIQGPTEGPEFGGIAPEAIGWATQVFLTEGERAMLPRPLSVGVG
jgi:hypothetical protein